MEYCTIIIKQGWVLRQMCEQVHFCVSNITDVDVKNNRIRVLKKNKKFFPKEFKGESQSYEIEIIYRGRVFKAIYRIGSRDGKSRSGIIRIERNDFQQMLIKSESTLFFKVLIPSQAYELLKVV